MMDESFPNEALKYLDDLGSQRHRLIHDVNSSQLGEAQWLREALLSARRGPVVHRATTQKVACRISPLFNCQTINYNSFTKIFNVVHESSIDSDITYH